jgi:hypothetical protein
VLLEQPSIDVTEPAFALCALLGLDPDFVAEIVLRPFEAKAVVFRRSPKGNKYVVDGRAATEEITFAVRISRAAPTGCEHDPAAGRYSEGRT